MADLGGFTFDGTHSSTYNGTIKSINRVLLPPTSPREVQLLRRHGVYNFNDETYRKRIIEVTLTFYSTNQVNAMQLARQVAEWLDSISAPKKLVFDNEGDKFYYAKLHAPVSLLPEAGIITAYIRFDCQPFAYNDFLTGQDVAWGDAEFTWLTDYRWGGSSLYTSSLSGAGSLVFNHDGTQAISGRSPLEGQSLIRLDGSWDELIVTLNGKSITHSAVTSSKELVIDNLNYTIELDSVNALADCSGDLEDFLTIEPGSNTIAISGTSLGSIDLTVDFRPEWR